jgi:16S rRNA (cytosine967-C5)-methyltransferase
MQILPWWANTLAKKVKACARSTAARVIAEVVQKKHSLNSVLAIALLELPDNERSLCQQLCYGVIRWQIQLDAISKQLLNKPLRAKEGDLAALLLCGIYQLKSMRIPPHAAISETVNACKTLGKPWATGLINATLRNYQRKHDEIENKLKTQNSTHYSHPDWLISRYKQDWPEQWQSILNANNHQPPMMLRVNQQNNVRDDYQAELIEADIPASAIEHCPDGILLASPCDVYALPGFSEGKASVQDGSAQRVATILDLKPNLRILDACAAPGGKTGHILEQQPDSHVVALDISSTRLQSINQNLQRLKLNAELIVADAAETASWWDGKLFDRILIDAPCSGTGVIRRNPDIKLLRRPDDISALAVEQKRLLDNLWPLLKPDGLLIYTTCSALKEENEQQIVHFLEQHPEAQEHEPFNSPATRREVGYQRLPGDDNLDGFYYACIQHR